MTPCRGQKVDLALQNVAKWWTWRHILAVLFAWHCWVSARNGSSIDGTDDETRSPYKVLIKSTC